MIRTDEDALVCDFAETYQVFNYKGLPLETAALLAVGLRENSRIKMKLSGIQASPEILLLASAVDRLSLLVWAQSKDAAKGRNKPKSILDRITPKQSDTSAFASGKDFEEERERLLHQLERTDTNGD